MPSKKPKASLASRASAKTPGGRALLKRALRDPGLRSKLPVNLLPPEVGAQRQLNMRLDAPITQGSSITERTLAREAKAAEQVQYGPQQQALGTQLATAQQVQRDTGSFYDQYLAQLAQNERDVANIQAGAQQALTQVGTGITGLAGTDAAQLQGQANQAAGARGAQAGDLSQMASGATATRQALVGSFQAQQALQGAGANTYASGLANVVGPTQKLSALAQGQRQVGKVQSDITALAGQRGAYNQQYRSQQRAAEGKNVLARQALGLSAEAKAATLQESAKKRRSQERQTTARLTSQERQDQARLEAQARQGSLNRENQRKLQALRDKAKGSSTALSKQEADDFYAKYGIKPQATAAVARGRDSVASVQNIISRQKGLPKTAASRAQLYSTLVAGQTADKKAKQVGIAKQNPLWTDVALDLWQYGGITGSTAHKLHLAGYPVKVLGFKNAPTTTQRNTGAYGKAPAQPQGHA